MATIDPVKRDVENGEFLTEKVVILRKRPSRSSGKLTEFRKNFGNGNRDSYPLIREHQLFRRFRVQDTLNRLKCMKRNKPMSEIEMMYHQDLINSLRKFHYSEKPPFRVPSESFSGVRAAESASSKIVSISRWEEFLYGVMAVEYCSKPDLHRKYRPAVIPYGFLRQYLPDRVLDLIIYALFFMVYFCSVSFYNNYLQLAGYILLATHLQIHLEAYEKNINIRFTGSCFQGPAFACVTSWCDHCQQKERERIVNNLMKKMKTDIVGRKASA
ncbi:uncharacterized protein LOC135205458 [Macrobrachium nipponense]|uniref:uncharacterized protein LOC135205458 n=1 Tax=Macrobrachium nipponense TaxID=159736 RepID=UPI0030C7DC9D